VAQHIIWTKKITSSSVGSGHAKKKSRIYSSGIEPSQKKLGREKISEGRKRKERKKLSLGLSLIPYSSYISREKKTQKKVGRTGGAKTNPKEKIISLNAEILRSRREQKEEEGAVGFVKRLRKCIRPSPYQKVRRGGGNLTMQRRSDMPTHSALPFLDVRSKGRRDGTGMQRTVLKTMPAINAGGRRQREEGRKKLAPEWKEKVGRRSRGKGLGLWLERPSSAPPDEEEKGGASCKGRLGTPGINLQAPCEQVCKINSPWQVRTSRERQMGRVKLMSDQQLQSPEIGGNRKKNRPWV